MNYSEKLKDPRWQKRRLEVFEKAGWKCCVCGSTEDTLHVHHLKYVGEPWDCPDGLLECLCEDCHEYRTECDEFFGKSELPTIFYAILTIIVNYAKRNVDFVKSWKGFFSDVFPALRRKQIKESKDEQKQKQEITPPTTQTTP